MADQDGAHDRGAGGGAADPAGDGDLHGGRDEEEDRDVPAVLQVHERRDHVTRGGGVQPDGREQRRRREAAQPGGGLLGGPRPWPLSVDPSGPWAPAVDTAGVPVGLGLTSVLIAPLASLGRRFAQAL